MPFANRCSCTWSRMLPVAACRPITHQRSGQGLRLSMEERPSPRPSAESAAAAAAGGSPSKADTLAAQLVAARLSDSANGPSAAGGSEAAAGCSSSSGSGTHVCVADARNENVLVGIRDGVLDTFDLVWRPQVGTSGGGAQLPPRFGLCDCMLSHSPAPHRPPPHKHTPVSDTITPHPHRSLLKTCTPHPPPHPANNMLASLLSLTHTPQARVSVLDSGFMLGDGVWEGIRLHKGVLAFAKPHLRRLYEGAKAIDLDLGATPKQLLSMVYATLDANGMGSDSGVHVRLMVSRGLKPTPYQNPKITLGKVWGAWLRRAAACCGMLWCGAEVAACGRCPVVVVMPARVRLMHAAGALRYSPATHHP